MSVLKNILTNTLEECKEGNVIKKEMSFKHLKTKLMLKVQLMKKKRKL